MKHPRRAVFLLACTLGGTSIAALPDPARAATEPIWHIARRAAITR